MDHEKNVVGVANGPDGPSAELAQERVHGQNPNEWREDAALWRTLGREDGLLVVIYFRVYHSVGEERVIPPYDGG